MDIGTYVSTICALTTIYFAYRSKRKELEAQAAIAAAQSATQIEVSHIQNEPHRERALYERIGTLERDVRALMDANRAKAEENLELRSQNVLLEGRIEEERREMQEERERCAKEIGELRERVSTLEERLRGSERE